MRHPVSGTIVLAVDAQAARRGNQLLPAAAVGGSYFGAGVVARSSRDAVFTPFESDLFRRPYQLLQLQEIVGLVLPVLDADMPDRIAGAVQQHQRHQATLEVEIHVAA